MKLSYLAGIGIALTGCIYASMAHPNSPRSIEIIGDSDCAEKTNEALDLLKEKAPEYYEIVENNIGAIQCAPDGSGLRMFNEPVTYVAGVQTINAGAIWYASTIAHDSCHAGLYNDYRESHDGNVPNEAWTGKKAEINCLLLQKEVLEELGAGDSTMQHMEDMLDSAYWDIPLSERWWQTRL